VSNELGNLTSDNSPLSIPISKFSEAEGGGCLPTNCRLLGYESADQKFSDALGSSVLRYVQASLAENTKRAYQSDIVAFLKWGGKIPTTAPVVALYLADSARSLSISTLQRRLIGLSRAHAALGWADPVKNEQVRATLRGIRRVHGKPPAQAAPLLMGDLLLLVDAIPVSVAGARDRCLLLMGFAAGFRRSELMSLRVEDVEFVPEGMLIVLRRSKTDQEGQGRKIGIPFGRTRACAVKALRQWLETAAISEGPLFRSVSKAGRVGSNQMSDQAVNLVLAKCAARAGLSSERLSGHSLRAGLVTSAAKAGVSAWKIRQQTGHRSDAMLQRYIRDADIFVGNAAGAIL